MSTNHWNLLHQQGKTDSVSHVPTTLAIEVEKLLSQKSNVLELGCGFGVDANYFAQCGHTVLATDFSETAIQKNREQFSSKDLRFEVFDMSHSFPYKNNSFHLVYARLSLHYFSDETTRKLIGEIHRVLKKDGLFCFVCKSTKDALYGVGKQIEKDMFDPGDHARHFFSPEYVQSILKNRFIIEKLEEGHEKFYNRNSAYVKVIARVTTEHVSAALFP